MYCTVIKFQLILLDKNVCISCEIIDISLETKGAIKVHQILFDGLKYRGCQHSAILWLKSMCYLCWTYAEVTVCQVASQCSCVEIEQWMRSVPVNHSMNGSLGIHMKTPYWLHRSHIKQCHCGYLMLDYLKGFYEHTLTLL